MTEYTPRLNLPIPEWDADWEKWQNTFRTALSGIDSFAFGLLEDTKLICKALPTVAIVDIGGGVYQLQPSGVTTFVSRTLQTDVTVSADYLTLTADSLIYVTIQSGAVGPQSVDWEIMQNGVAVDASVQVLGYVNAGYEIIWYNGSTLPVATPSVLFAQTAAGLIVSLDDAYNDGRTITADAGPVIISVPDATNSGALEISQLDVTNDPYALKINSTFDPFAVTGANIELASPGGTSGIVTRDEALYVFGYSTTAVTEVGLASVGTSTFNATSSVGSNNTSSGDAISSISANHLGAGDSLVSLLSDHSGGNGDSNLTVDVSNTGAGSGTVSLSLTASNAGAGTADITLEAKSVITFTAGGSKIAEFGTAGALIKQRKEVFIPIEWAQETPGGSPPEAKSDTVDGNGTLAVRRFSGAAVEEVTIPWIVPDSTDATEGITYTVHGVVTEATPPASGEGVVFKLAGYSVGLGDGIDGTFGTEVESEDTDLFASGCTAQYDAFITGESGIVTVTDLAKNETVYFHFKRDTADVDDTYVQDVGISGITIFRTTRTA